MYEVRAQPGPLGIIIDSPEEGPIVHEVKEGSPLWHLAKAGDNILAVDGVDCSTYNADAVAYWISTKPIGREQVLVLAGNPKWVKSACSENDLSV